jgi:hypothetical protein
MTGFLAFVVLVLLACNDAWSAGLFDESVQARMLNQGDGRIAHIERAGVEAVSAD